MNTLFRLVVGIMGFVLWLLFLAVVSEAAVDAWGTAAETSGRACAEDPSTRCKCWCILLLYAVALSIAVFTPGRNISRNIHPGEPSSGSYVPLEWTYCWTVLRNRSASGATMSSHSTSRMVEG